MGSASDLLGTALEMASSLTVEKLYFDTPQPVFKAVEINKIILTVQNLRMVGWIFTLLPRHV